MVANTFSSVREPIPRIRLEASYTFRLVMLPGKRFFDNRAPYTHGTLAMTGWVRSAAAVPQQRIVLLKIWPANEVIASTRSDPLNAGNNYFFNGLAALESGERYVLEVLNVDGTTAARIKDSRVPV